MISETINFCDGVCAPNRCGYELYDAFSAILETKSAFRGSFRREMFTQVTAGERTPANN
jgi:hypothetical protein